ncbi:MAG: hypothetical protein EOP83_09655 [Verrucomicrobiaceae bacterium]|nr:MAG: hypothetical protein EOP83_09655 [Verrucomicrobiaceae bacterium]
MSPPDNIVDSARCYCPAKHFADWQRNVMPRYFFDIEDAEGASTDDTGLEMAGFEDAVAEARRSAAEIAKESIQSGSTPPLTIRVRGEGHNVVFTISWVLANEADARPGPHDDHRP